MTDLDNFLTYVKIDTQASEDSLTYPSTEKQLNLSRLLLKQLQDLGVKDSYIDEWGIVYAHIPGEKGYSTVGLNSHVDCAMEVSDTNVKPQVHKNYQGEEIILNDEYKMSPKEFPILNEHIGHDLVTASGDTLLGADDKAGDTIIMGVVSRIMNDPSIKHHPISIAFTVDEEIGKGPLHFDTKKMNADYAYTIDGSYINDIGIKNFNAYGVDIHIKGNAIHPGEGKGKLINAILMFHELLSYMKEDDSPYNSEDEEGFYHLLNCNATSEILDASLIVRDFDIDGVNERLNRLLDGKAKLEEKYRGANFQIDINIYPQYKNMYSCFKEGDEVIENAKEAIIKNGLTPTFLPIRGGTDGAQFTTDMGLLTPNLGTGSYNHHGRYEFLDVNELEKMIDIVMDIVKI